jgi:hypothetical protein
MDARFYGESWFTMLRCQESLKNGHIERGDKSILPVVKDCFMHPQ